MPIESYYLYVNTWSALVKYNNAHKDNTIMQEFKKEFMEAWNTSDEKKEIKVIWDMHVVLTKKQ